MLTKLFTTLQSSGFSRSRSGGQNGRRSSKDGDATLITLHAWPTLDCLEVVIALEEIGAAYEIRSVDPGPSSSGELRHLGPDMRIPVLVDSSGPDGTPIALPDSPTILLYLAERYSALLPARADRRSDAVQWLALRAGGLGAFCGEALYYRHHAREKLAYPNERYGKEARRHFQVLETRLNGRDYLAETYSIADIGAFPWVGAAAALELDLAAFPALSRWHDSIAMRPAVKRAYLKLPQPGATSMPNTFVFPAAAGGVV